MIEVTRQFVGLAKKIDTVADVVDILQWAIEQDGLYCTVAARADNTWLIEIGGVSVSSVHAEIGQWVVYDGDQFHALTQEQFAAKGYEA